MVWSEPTLAEPAPPLSLLVLTNDDEREEPRPPATACGGGLSFISGAYYLKSYDSFGGGMLSGSRYPFLLLGRRFVSI